jgi:4-amino-4-deoxy-L-arabinose transferase-like glycosyltransferase
MSSRPLLLILALYLLLALATSVIVPLGEAPDELDHFLYIQYVARERAFPVMSPVFEENETLEANQPPLYYLLGVLAGGWLGRDQPLHLPLNSCFAYDPADPGRQTFYRHDPAEQFPWHGPYLAFHLVRALSVLMGAGAVLLAYAIGRRLTPDKQPVAILAAALLAFNPQFIFITASANNDNLTTLLGAAIVLFAIRVAQRDMTSNLAFGSWELGFLSLLIGLGALTKFGLLALWPLAFLAVLWPALPYWREKQWRIPWAGLLLTTILPLLVAGWWYIRAYRLYGDPLAWDVHLAAKGVYVLRTTPLQPADLLDFALTHFQSYWGWFGWLNIKLPGWAYWLLAVVVLAAVIGLLLRIVYSVFKDNTQYAIHNTLHVSRFTFHAPLLFTLLATLAIYASLFRYIQTINWSGYQGRLAYAVAAPIAALLATGLFNFYTFLSRSTLLSPRSTLLEFPRVPLSSLLFVLPAATLIFILAPAYPRPQIYQPPLDSAVFLAECPRFPTGLQLEGYHLPAQTQPGQTLPITLYGYALSDSPNAQSLAVQLIGRAGEVVASGQTSLTWQAGEVISTTLMLPVSADALPARATLQAGLLSAPDGEWQPATTPGGRSLDLPIALTTLKIAPAEPLIANPQHPTDATFGNQLALLGYDRTGDSLTFYWQALAPMSEDYTIFVHGLDAAGNLLAQHDGPPQEGNYPTAIWSAGEIVSDTISLPLPAGTTQLAIGVYLLSTLERLPVTANDAVQPDGRLLLPLP